jgi:hypothetical protein
VHAFIKRITPSRLRRVMGTRFKNCRPKLGTFYKLNIARFELTRTVRSRRSRLKASANIRYLPRAAREFVRHHPSTSLPQAPIAKRRFAPLPLKTVQGHTREIRRKERPELSTRMRPYRAGLLRQALRNRMIERPFTDMVEELHRRRLPREQVPPP